MHACICMYVFTHALDCMHACVYVFMSLSPFILLINNIESKSVNIIIILGELMRDLIGVRENERDRDRHRDRCLTSEPNKQRATRIVVCYKMKTLQMPSVV